MEKRSDVGERLTNEDLLIEVLSRLRVKSLLRCKAVSKTWLFLISSPNFIKSHLNRAVNNDDETLIGKISQFSEDEDFEQVDSSFSLIHYGYCDFVAHLIFPYSKADYNFYPYSYLVGSDCGIVCVSVNVLPDLPYLYLWNPATKRSKLIPPHSIHADDNKKIVALGVAFDLVHFDFKVVRVVYPVPAKVQSLGKNAYMVVHSANNKELYSAIKNAYAEVYSANENAWRNIEPKLTDIPCRNSFDLCIHGFLLAKGYNGMMAFDLSKEVFIFDIKLPASSNDSSTLTLIVEFKDSIAVVVFKNNDDKFNLFKLDDEACLHSGGGGEIETSWTIMLSINVGRQFKSVLGLFNNVEFLLLVPSEMWPDEWFSYNSDTKEGRYMHIYPFFDFYNVFKYKESLLSIPGSKLIDWPADEDDSEGSNANSEDDSEKSSDDSETDRILRDMIMSNVARR